MTKSVELNDREKSDLRDRLAMSALTGFCCSSKKYEFFNKGNQNIISAKMYDIADAMMKAREND